MVVPDYYIAYIVGLSSLFLGVCFTTATFSSVPATMAINCKRVLLARMVLAETPWRNISTRLASQLPLCMGKLWACDKLTE